MNEDEPLEKEVAVDPEMLGKIFENLLDVTDRKSKGAFYTPREIVHYMCQESLTNYLVNTVGTPYEDTKDFVLYGEIMKDEDCSREAIYGFSVMQLPDSIYKNLKAIDDALADVRIADPAVGSGAFPMGMLSEIVKLRNIITEYMARDLIKKPEFANWKHDQKVFSMVNIERWKLRNYQRNAYKLKQETIRNSIYAVDIEPSAVDIAKLRLWLTLVVEQEIDPNDSENDSPLTLPNLDCNIMCGNSLIDEFEGIDLSFDSVLFGNNGQGTIWGGGIDTDLERLFVAEHDYFYANTRDKKIKYADAISEIKGRLIDLAFTSADTQKRERFNEALSSASTPFFLWKLNFAKVFKDKGGFDIVIGNPPYRLCQPSNTDEKLLHKYRDFHVAGYKIDLFHLFFEKGIELLKKKGTLSYITPNTYLTNKYIKPLRKYILENCTIHQIINHDKVFDAASVDTATIVLSKIVSEDNQIKILRSSNFVFTEVCCKNQADWYKDKDFIFNISNNAVSSTKKCVLLGDICKTYFGIQAFDRKSSISEEKISDCYLPIIDGADISPYSYAKPKIYFNYLPENIKSGGDWEVYSRERIVVRQIGQIPIVGLCEKNILGSNTLYSIYPINDNYNLKFLLACLNSSFIKQYWKAKYSDNKALFPKIKGFQLKELPIPIAEPEIQSLIAELVSEIIELWELGKESQQTEKKLDEILNELYVKE